MTELVRAFLSIDIQNQSLLPRISEIQKLLSPAGAKMKLVEIENVHFTLRFLGDISLTQINEIETCLKQVKFDPFEIQVEGVGAFPKRNRPRVIWIGVTKNSDRILDIKKEIEMNLEELGYPPERTKFTPHATIARVRYIKDAKIISTNIEELTEERVGSMMVSYFSMKKSTLTTSGPIYDTLWQVP